LIRRPKIPWADSDKTFPGCSGFSCFFQPLQKQCKNFKNGLSQSRAKVNWTNERFFTPTAFERKWGPLFYGAALTAWWWRPHKRLTKKLALDAAAIGLKPAGNRCIAIHVRHGDTCPRNNKTGFRKCTAFEVYMRRAEKYRTTYNYTSIFLATDDARVIDEVSLYPHFDFMYFKDFNRTKYDSPEGVFIETLGIKRLGNAFYDALRDIHAASLCEALIGSFQSSMSHMMFYRMVYRLGIVPPFFSVDSQYCRKRMDSACCLAGLMRQADPVCFGFKRQYTKPCVTR